MGNISDNNKRGVECQNGIPCFKTEFIDIKTPSILYIIGQGSFYMQYLVELAYFN